LVSIIGAATTLIEGGQAITAESRHQLAETIRQEGERLNRYVQNLLDMTRISYGALALNMEWIEPRELVGRAVRQLKRELDSFQVTVDVPLLLPAIKGDPVLLEQAFANVLDNAGKYAPPGSAIAVSAERLNDGITFAVDDQGPGIAVPDRERVFDLFYRVGKGDRQGKGTGLGLAISRGILEAHGGTIRALPGKNGAGTRIAIHLPLSDTAAARKSTVQPVLKA
jgi:two-component system, OmpR family, sensor histidine kinase KdpD